MDDSRPDLITQSQHNAPRSFEDTLRDVVRTSPYIALSVVVHSLVLFLVWLIPAPEIVLEDEPTIMVGPVTDPPPLVLPPPVDTPIEPDDIPVETPVVSDETPVPTEVDHDVSSANVDPSFASSTDLRTSPIGTGGGTIGGKIGERGFGPGGGGEPPGNPFNHAVRDALIWLSFHQVDYGDGTGYWDGAAFDLQCGKLGDDTRCDGLSTTAQHNVGLTGLSLLAFLGAGNTMTDGEFSDTVKRGLLYLIEGQDADGCLASQTSTTHTYDHLIATLALTEASAFTRSNRMLRKATVRAHEYMYSLRNPGGAWRYAPTHPEMSLHADDVSVTGWAILAMTLAKDMRGMPFEQGALDDALLFIEEMTDESGRTGYIERGGFSSRLTAAGGRWDPARSEAMTAVGVLSRIFADPKLERPGAREAIAKGVDLILAQPMEWDDEDVGTIDFYYWYYATYALHQYSIEPDGRDAWRKWQERMLDAVVDRQIREGEQKGSWAPQVDPWGSIGGRVYSTAILALSLEVFYRYETVLGSQSGR